MKQYTTEDDFLFHTVVTKEEYNEMIKDFDIFTTVKWRNYVVNCCPKPPKLDFMDSGKQGVFLNRDGKIFFRSYDIIMQLVKKRR